MFPRYYRSLSSLQAYNIEPLLRSWERSVVPEMFALLDTPVVKGAWITRTGRLVQRNTVNAWGMHFGLQELGREGSIYELIEEDSKLK